MHCVLWNRLIVVTIALGTLAFSTEGTPNLLLGIGCAALTMIVGDRAGDGPAAPSSTIAGCPASGLPFDRIL